MDQLARWQRAVAWIALLKVAVALAAFLVALLTGAAGVTPRYLLMLAFVVAYASAAILLTFASRRDRRAAVLGVSMLFTGAVFADRLIDPFHDSASGLMRFVAVLFAVRVDALNPFFVWMFVREFPRRTGFGARMRLPGIMMLAAAAVGIVLIASNLVLFTATALDAAPALRTALGHLSRDQLDGSYYFAAQYVLLLPALPVLLWRTNGAPRPERRRVRLLVGGLVAGVVPPVLYSVLFDLAPSLRPWMPLKVVGWVLYPALISTPLTVAYAVLVHRALDVRLVVRRAVRYALARRGVFLLSSVPFAALIFALWTQRDLSLAQVLSRPGAIVLVILAVLGVAATRGRKVILERIDRRFFREQYDSRLILGQLVDRCGRATSVDELSAIMRTEIDRALHPESSAVLFSESRSGVLAAPRGDVRPIDATSGIAGLLLVDAAVDVDLEEPSASVAGLPERDRSWLADAGARLLVPLRDSERSLVGLIVLGEKKSELPYSSEDRFLLATVGSAAALSLAFLTSQRRHGVEVAAPPEPPPQEELSAECTVCGTIHGAGTKVCAKCGAPCVNVDVPLILVGKFRFVQRLGMGSMGVVYRGLDLQLDRAVAIKTLPRVVPDLAVRLRREARAMAALAHPNLALIYGAESWHGRPMLIFEYLGGGTLADHLIHGKLSRADTLTLGITLAGVVAAIHRAGILHRDIKPSNIGFARDGTVKILDFGVARLLGYHEEQHAGIERLMAKFTGEHAGEGAHLLATPEGQSVGTPLYMSPEAVRSMPADPSFDLWSICMVLYEALAGTHPARAATLPLTWRKIEAADVPDLRTFVPHADEPLCAFFRRAFAKDRAARPANGDALAAQLRALTSES